MSSHSVTLSWSWSRAFRFTTLPMYCSSQFCSTMPKARSESSRPTSSGDACGMRSERFDLAEVAVIHPDEVEAALVVSHQEPRQVSIARQEDFQHWIGRGMGKGRVGLAVALDDVSNGETPHAVLSVAPR